MRVSQSQSCTIRTPQQIIDALRAGKRGRAAEEQSATAVAASATAVDEQICEQSDEQPDEQSDELFSAASADDAQSATAVEEQSAEEELLTEADELLRDVIDDQVRMASLWNEPP